MADNNTNRGDRLCRPLLQAFLGSAAGFALLALGGVGVAHAVVEWRGVTHALTFGGHAYAAWGLALLLMAVSSALSVFLVLLWDRAEAHGHPYPHELLGRGKSAMILAVGLALLLAAFIEFAAAWVLMAPADAYTIAARVVGGVGSVVSLACYWLACEVARDGARWGKQHECRG